MNERKRPAKRVKTREELYYSITKPDKYGRVKRVKEKEKYKDLVLLYISSDHQLPKYYIIFKGQTILYRCYGDHIAEKRFKQCCENYNLFTA